jgi:signal transduction histidine kinase
MQGGTATTTASVRPTRTRGEADAKGSAREADLDERVLIMAPLVRDASLARATLEAAGITARVCADMAELEREAAAGAGALLLTQEALGGAALDRLLAVLERQPPWSDLPSVVLVSGGAGTPASARLAGVLGPRANATLLERPVRAATLVGAVQVALRARRRQYELRRHVQALAEARAATERATQVRDRFLASAAHDLKNPLSAIKGYAQLLRRRTARGEAPPDGFEQALAAIEDMAVRAAQQLDDLLDLARLQAQQALQLDVGPVDLVALARRAAAEFQLTTNEHQLRVETALPELVGVWDARRIERVIGNLLSNAIKYSPTGGEIVVEVARRGTAPQGWAILAVRDQGIGIPPQDVPRIFEHYFRASNVHDRMPGLGLGLAGARQIVEQHGGTIDLASTPGEGSTFTVTLPLVSAESTASTAAAAQELA